MSVASEFPPEVYIPVRARRSPPASRHLAAVPAGFAKPAGVAMPAGFAMPAGVAVPPAVAMPVGAEALRIGRASFQASRVLAVGDRLTVRRSEPVRVCDDGIRASAAPLRLTRRGVAALVVAGVVAAGLFLLVAHASRGLAPSGSRHGSSVTAGSVVVQDGDTLWSIAQRVRPAADPREVVDQLRRVNHLSSVSLSPGQTLKVG